MAGYTTSSNGDVSGQHGGYDMWAVKLDGNGSLQWQKCMGGTASEEAFAVQQTSDGGFFVAGFTESNNGDITGNQGGTDLWVIKLGSIGTSVTDMERSPTFTTSPNPTTGILSLRDNIGVYAWHGAHHLAQIIELKRRQGWL